MVWRNSNSLTQLDLKFSKSKGRIPENESDFLEPIQYKRTNKMHYVAA